MGCYHPRYVDITCLHRGANGMLSNRLRGHEEFLQRGVTSLDQGLHWADHLDVGVHSTRPSSSRASAGPLCDIFRPFCRLLLRLTDMVSATPTLNLRRVNVVPGRSTMLAEQEVCSTNLALPRTQAGHSCLESRPSLVPGELAPLVNRTGLVTLTANSHRLCRNSSPRPSPSRSLPRLGSL